MDMSNRKTIIKTGLEIIVLVVTTFLVFKYVLILVEVDGSSMYPTLHDKDIAVINALNTDQDGIKRFDIIVLDTDEVDKKIVKRVVGLPGETIIYNNDRLYINGVYFEEKFLDKKYIAEAKNTYNAKKFTNDFEVVVGNDEVFVLGDNRLRSSDSRTYGTFKYDDIIGKKGIILYPFSNIKWME